MDGWMDGWRGWVEGERGGERGRGREKEVMSLMCDLNYTVFQTVPECFGDVSTVEILK